VTKVRLSGRADRDLSKIFLYTIETFGLKQARRYLSDLQHTLEQLPYHPKLGARIEELPDVRRLVRKSHVIFYRHDEDGILILSVKHTRRGDADKP
jgi:toxin ParE1/3/4